MSNQGVTTFGVLLLVGQVLAACTGAPPPAPSVKASSGQYLIGPGDVLSIYVYQSPELSVADLPVRPDGDISVPLVPDIKAIGKTSTELAHEIAFRLQRYVKDPNVTVMIRSFDGPFDRQIRVIGQATKPIAIPYRTGMTLLDVMIQTKGLTRFAAGNRAIIVRRGADGKEHDFRVRLGDLINDGDISQNVKMQPGDTLIIPESWF